MRICAGCPIVDQFFLSDSQRCLQFGTYFLNFVYFGSDKGAWGDHPIYTKSAERH